MKRLLVAMAAVAAVATAFAKITATNEFESSFADFVADTADEDASELASYASNAPAFSAPYPCSGFGAKYLSLDTGNATLWRTNATEGDVCFDMAMQFNSRTSEPAVAADTKIAVYLNSSSNLVVIAGTSANDRTPKSYVTATEVVPGSWKRLTISSENTESGLEFTVRLDGTVLTADSTSAFPCLTDDTTVREIGFAGTGALDDYVARTTNPYVHPANYIARVGSTDDGEYYETFADALADGQTAITSTTYNFRTANGEDYDAATNPYVIANVEDLLALMYVGDKTKNYVQTANIDMTDVAPFLGIGPFSGVYDGGDFTIANVTLAVAEYTGIFGKVTGTVKNLTVNNMDFGDVTTGSFGCAIVGQAEGNAVLQNLKASGTFCGAGDAGARHNTAGIVVLVETTAGNGTVTIRDCVNNATVYGRHHRVGGILAYTRNEGNVVISNCVNNGTLVWTSKTDPADPCGIAGIVACPEGTGTVTIMDCTNTGTFTVNNANSAENAAAATGDIVGHFYGKASSGTFVEDGGNTYIEANKLVGTVSNTVTVTKCQYAVASTVDNVDYLTTVKSVRANHETYTLLDDIAASATPVVILDNPGDYVAFNTNGFNFAGTVAVADPNMMDVTSTTLDSVITFTAAGGTAVAEITKDETTTQYNTLAKALAAAESGDTVTLVADSSEAVTVDKSINFVEGENATFTGTFDGDGSVAMTAKPKKYTSTTVANGPTLFASTWTGTYKINWNPGNARFVFNDFGNASSTIEIGVDFNGFPSGAWGNSAAGDGAPTILSAIVLSGNWTISNTGGWGGTTTYIPKLSGNGSFTVAANYDCTYEIGSVDGYTGMLKTTPVLVAGVYGKPYIKIGNIVAAESLDYDTCLVSATSTVADVAFCSKDLMLTTVNSATQKLAVGVVNGESGIYRARAAATIDAVVTYYVSVQEAIAAGAAATDNTTVPSVTVYDSTSAEFVGWTYANGTYTYTVPRAKIGETGYATLTAAIAAAGAAEATIDLVAACTETVTIPANVTVAVADDVSFTGAVAGGGTIVYTKTPGANHPTYAAGQWTGAVKIDYDATGGAGIDSFGITGSTVEFTKNFIGNYTPGSGNTDYTVGPALKITGYFEMTDGTTQRNIIFPKVTGTGTLAFTTKERKYVIQSLEDWDGTLTNNYTTVQIENIVSGTGTIVANVKPTTAPTVGAGWRGTYVANHDIYATNVNAAAIAPDAYGVAGSTVVIGSAMEGFFSKATISAAPSIASSVYLKANVTITNGFFGTAGATTFAELGADVGVVLTTRQAQKDAQVDRTTYYTFTKLKDYAGSIVIRDNCKVKIVEIAVDSIPAVGTRVLNVTCDATGAEFLNLDSTTVTVGGEAQDIALEYLADGAEGAGLYVKDTTVYVAQIGETKYATLTGAVAAATSGATVTLLSNITLDARVEPNLGENTTLAINLGGYTITREGTSGNGSVFDVKSGVVTITNGVINCTQDDTAIAKDGVYAITARSGAALTLDALTVTVNSECGACVYPFSGATVAILGGTYANNTTTPYRYKTAWTGMAVNQVNKDTTGGVAQQLITITGGSFKHVNPALGDDSWADGEGTFLATGKTTTLEGGYWVVGEAPSDPWNTPSSDAGVADALSTDGLTTESDAIATVADFNALVNYITNHVTGVAAPADMTDNQKANAVLCYALNATTIPDTVIKSVTIDAITQPDANGAMTLTVAIPDVPVGETVDASLLAKVVSAKGGTALGSMSAENVTVSGYGAENGKVVITVTPKVPAGDPAPTTFFTSAVITK